MKSYAIFINRSYYACYPFFSWFAVRHNFVAVLEAYTVNAQSIPSRFARRIWVEAHRLQAHTKYYTAQNYQAFDGSLWNSLLYSRCTLHKIVIGAGLELHRRTIVGQPATKWKWQTTVNSHEIKVIWILKEIERGGDEGAEKGGKECGETSFAQHTRMRNICKRSNGHVQPPTIQHTKNASEKDDWKTQRKTIEQRIRTKNICIIINMCQSYPGANGDSAYIKTCIANRPVLAR